MNSIFIIFSKYAWVFPLTDKNDILIPNAFHKFLDGSRLKPNKTCVDKGSDFTTDHWNHGYKTT